MAAFEINIKKEEGWETIYRGQTIGHKHIIPMIEETDKLRFRCVKSVGDNVRLREFAVY